MITVYKEPFFLVHIKIKEHKKYKDKLLKLIEQSPKEHDTKLDNVTHDFNIKHKLYKDTFFEMVNPYLEEVKKIFYVEQSKFNFGIDNVWFQQYKKNEYHAWHTHAQCNFSNVYYLENNHPTEFYNLVTKFSLNVNVKEGDLLMFPAYIPHRSQPNNTDKRKTVIVFNSNIK